VTVNTIVTPDIEVAVAALARGRLVAFPTETVYGLGADAADGAAVAAVFAAKGRPPGHPLIVHLASADDVAEWARLDGDLAVHVKLLAEAFWPGPLTVVLPRTAKAADETVGGRPTIGLRVPDHPVALELLRRFGGGVAAPSANRFGRVSPTTAAHVVDDLGGLVDVVLDGGATTVGIESTIVEVLGDEPILLRPGAVTKADLERALGVEVLDGSGGEARAPGMLRSHYAPDAAVELVEPDQLASEISVIPSAEVDRIGIVAPVVVDHQPSWHLPSDADGYGRELYRALREADRLGVERLLVVPPTEGRLLAAVVDRLTKAAARPERP